MPKSRSRAASSRPPILRARQSWLIGGIAVVAVALVAVAVAALPGLLSGIERESWTEAARGGSWTNVSADALATMLPEKDFTLVNVKTPYIGEIDGTDLWVPYDQLAARAAELPADRNARILVYCRSGAESRIAAQTLLDLGYRDVWNLDGGMQAWQASGRTLVERSRS